MNTNDYLDALAQVSVANGGRPTTYAIAKMLGIQRSYMVRYRRHGATFGDHLAIQIADILGIHRGAVLCDMAAQRSKYPEMANEWKKLADHFHELAPDKLESDAA